MWQGETVIITAPVTENGSPKTLTGATVTWKAVSGDDEVEKSGTVVSVDDSDDGVQISLEPADTKDLPDREYAHECRVVLTGDENVVFAGTMTLKESSTKPV